MIEIKNLTISDKRNERIFINNLTINISQGEKVAVIGEEGCGKSTLLKYLYGNKTIFDYVDTVGKCNITFKKIGYLEQELYFHGPIYTYFEDEVFCDNNVINQSCIELGLEPNIIYSDKSIDSLSGGEKVKLQLLKQVLNDSELLLLDEPSNDLDINTIMWLEKFIRQTNKTIIFISHDLCLLKNTATRIIEIEQNLKNNQASIYTFKGSYDEYSDYKNNSIIKQERISNKEKAEFKIKQDKLNKVMQNVENDLRSVSRQNPHGAKMLKRKMKAVKAQEKRLSKEYENLTPPPYVAKEINIHIENAMLASKKQVVDLKIGKLIVEGKLLIEDVNISVYGNKKICIIGENGSGKTTLLKAIYSEIISRSLKVFYMPQQYSEVLNYEMTPLDFLLQFSNDNNRGLIINYLRSAKLTITEINNSIENLSEGQKAKVLMIMLIIAQCSILILDEPTRNISPLSIPVFLKNLSEFSGCIISVSHDREYISQVCNEVYEIKNKNLIKL